MSYHRPGSRSRRAGNHARLTEGRPRCNPGNSPLASRILRVGSVNLGKGTVEVGPPRVRPSARAIDRAPTTTLTGVRHRLSVEPGRRAYTLARLTRRSRRETPARSRSASIRAWQLLPLPPDEMATNGPRLGLGAVGPPPPRGASSRYRAIAGQPYRSSTRDVGVGQLLREKRPSRSRLGARRSAR